MSLPPLIGYRLDGGFDDHRYAPAPAVQMDRHLFVFNYVAPGDVAGRAALQLASFVVACGGIDISNCDPGRLGEVLAGCGAEFNIGVIAHGDKEGAAGRLVCVVSSRQPVFDVLPRGFAVGPGLFSWTSLHKGVVMILCTYATFFFAHCCQC
jgi:hypothetical protein